jgi:hypothetical protein
MTNQDAVSLSADAIVAFLSWFGQHETA